MSDENLTKLERLAVLLRDDGREPESMSPEQLVEYLQKLKVQMEVPQKRFDVLLKKAKAQQRLERARIRRLKAIEAAKSLLQSGTIALDATRSRVGEMIRKLGKSDPDQALVYAREFEKATPEDMATLEQDLRLLEIEDDETGNP